MQTLLSREESINKLLNNIPKDGLVVGCNGRISRELFELRKKRKEPTNDFYMLGSMGCAIPLALGLALNTKKKVYCLVGDGNFLMKLGALVTAFKCRPNNLYIIVINNDRHDSTGGQPTAFSAIRHFLPVKIIDVLPGSRKDLGRPTMSGKQITKNFRKKICS